MTAGPARYRSDPYDCQRGRLGSRRRVGDRGRGEGDGRGDGDAGGPRRADGPFDLLHAGTAFGTFVHGVLEEVDFGSPIARPGPRPAIRGQARRRGVDLGTLAPEGRDGVRLLVEGLRSTIGSPLGPLFSGRSLADLAIADRLDELGFDLRLGDGGRHPSVRDIGRLVVAPPRPGHPLRAWAEGLAGGPSRSNWPAT